MDIRLKHRQEGLHGRIPMDLVTQKKVIDLQSSPEREDKLDVQSSLRQTRCVSCSLLPS